MASSLEIEKENFLKEVDKVCQRYGFCIAHEDTQGGFIIERYDKDLADWLQQAAIGLTLRKNKIKDK